jgi:hypothetical protein
MFSEEETIRGLVATTSENISSSEEATNDTHRDGKRKHCLEAFRKVKRPQ